MLYLVLGFGLRIASHFVRSARVLRLSGLPGLWGFGPWAPGSVAWCRRSQFAGAVLVRGRARGPSVN